MPSYSELKKGARILLNNQPCEIIESAPMFKGRGQSVLQARIKNLITGESVAWTFRPSDSFEEPDISERCLRFLYSHRDDFVFCEDENPGKRFTLSGSRIGKMANFLKPQQSINSLFFRGELANISMPVKIALRIGETAPAIKRQSAQSGTKPAVLETGAKINVPLFIQANDVIEVNTETGEYVKRISKA